MSGQRIRHKCEKYNLDLTYITPRIIAMSYPACDFMQKMYRNDIQDVANYLEDNHKDKYVVINVSGKQYDTSPFNGMVLEESWEDHHSPTLLLLTHVCRSMFNFLSKDPENVCVVHCNAGKGRTGTLICCYLLFCGFADCAKNAIAYYGWKRFKHGLGVTQPG